MIAFEHDGTFKWLSDDFWRGPYSWGSPALADLNGNGFPEIIMGASVFDNTGTLIWRGDDFGGEGRGDNQAGPLSIVADLNLDGSPNIVAGRSAYHADGSLYWNAPIPDGFPAVGNFDADPYPEVVVVASGSVYMLEHDGTIKWGPVTIPGGGLGGAPTIADMTGNGIPDIGVAGKHRYTVFRADGSVVWETAILGLHSPNLEPTRLPHHQHQRRRFDSHA